MFMHPALIAEFDQLTAPLVISGLDLPAWVQRLEDSATLAVRSLLGWCLVVTVDGADLSLTAVHPGVVVSEVRASLRVPLSTFVTDGCEGSLIFYAAAPYAFVQMARDLHGTLGQSSQRLRLDADLNPDLTPGLKGVREMATINQAIGLLIHRGKTAEQAKMHLQDQARVAKLTLHETAEKILHELS